MPPGHAPDSVLSALRTIPLSLHRLYHTLCGGPGPARTKITVAPIVPNRILISSMFRPAIPEMRAYGITSSAVCQAKFPNVVEFVGVSKIQSYKIDFVVAAEDTDRGRSI